MKAIVLGLCVLGLSGCFHTTKPGLPKQEQAEKKKPAAKKGTGRAQPAAREEETAAAPPSSSGVPLSTSPGGLLTDDGLAAVQEKLVDEGHLERTTGAFDERTRSALKDFQKKNGLAATGAPDLATVRQLGLEPEGIFRQ
jgi:peptidoglycan hydrolase-like protein with peptidoglycan-binding domain